MGKKEEVAEPKKRLRKTASARGGYERDLALGLHGWRIRASATDFVRLTKLCWALTVDTNAPVSMRSFCEQAIRSAFAATVKNPAGYATPGPCDMGEGNPHEIAVAITEAEYVPLRKLCWELQKQCAARVSVRSFSENAVRKALDDALARRAEHAANISGKGAKK